MVMFISFGKYSRLHPMDDEETLDSDGGDVIAVKPSLSRAEQIRVEVLNYFSVGLNKGTAVGKRLSDDRARKIRAALPVTR